MSVKFPTFSRRTRRSLFAATALLSLAIWLTLTVAESCRPLHAWLHGGTIPDDDDCAIVMIIHGKVDVSVAIVDVSVVQVVLVDEVLEPPLIFAPVDYSLLPGRGPPSLDLLS